MWRKTTAGLELAVVMMLEGKRMLHMFVHTQKLKHSLDIYALGIIKTQTQFSDSMSLNVHLHA